MPADAAASEHPVDFPLVPAAIVVFQPDPRLLATLVASLGRRRIYVFLNGEADLALSAASDVVVIRSPTNVGQGAALNALVEQAAADGAADVLLLDQDSTLAPGLPEILRERSRRREARAAVVAPVLVPPAGEGYRPIRYSWRDRSSGAVHFAPTSGSLLSINAWRAVGPFRADYFIGCIDVEWGFRAWHRGYGSFVESDVTMTHRWGSPQRDGHGPPQILRQSDQRTYFYLRNAVDCLGLSFIPLRWRVSYGTRLLGQVVSLLFYRRFDRPARKLVVGAVRAGLRGELGPLR